jgi:hypothetical protein
MNSKHKLREKKKLTKSNQGKRISLQVIQFSSFPEKKQKRLFLFARASQSYCFGFFFFFFLTLCNPGFFFSRKEAKAFVLVRKRLAELLFLVLFF